MWREDAVGPGAMEGMNVPRECKSLQTAVSTEASSPCDCQHHSFIPSFIHKRPSTSPCQGGGGRTVREKIRFLTFRI